MKILLFLFVITIIGVAVMLILSSAISVFVNRIVLKATNKNMVPFISTIIQGIIVWMIGIIMLIYGNPLCNVLNGIIDNFI